MTAAKTTAQRQRERAPKTSTKSVAALRLARGELGLRRLELYAHPEDWPAIKALAAKLQRRRTVQPKKEN